MRLPPILRAPSEVSNDRLRLFAVVALATVQTGGSAPTPVYRIYQETLGLSPALVTLVFAVYPLSLLASLLTVGSLSDHVGRRPLMIASLLLSAASMVVFLYADSAATLVFGRIVQGLATGAAASSLGAVILDTDRLRGPLINSVTAFVGVTIGALGSSVLVAYAPDPTRLVYAILLVAFLMQALAVRWLPETATAKPGALASLKPHADIPPQAWKAFVKVMPVNIAGWALGGFYLSLMPSIFRVATGLSSPFIGGAVVASLTLSGAAAIVLRRDRDPARILPEGAAALALGVTLTLVGVRLQAVPVLAVGTLIAGFGFGASFFGAARTILPLAAPDERAGLLSAFYVESYLAFSVPAIAVGFAAPMIGLIPATYAYGSVVIVLALASLAATRVRRQPRQPGGAARSCLSVSRGQTPDNAA